MMKKWILGAAALLIGATAAAQVEKQVEVTKAYVPSLEQATKLRIEPDMTDTTTMRPDIDYTITPLSLQTALATRPIRPATVTYWEFNRPRPFYLKAAVGAPLQSALDFYAATQHPSTGYALGYLQHVGRYGKLKNDFSVKNSATRMTNRVGVAAGKYLGNHIVEGDINYRHRLDRRYGMHYPTESLAPGTKIGYSDANLALRIGDDFLNLERVNFEVALDGSLFFDHSDPIVGDEQAQQTNLSARVKLAKAFSRHRFSLEAAYHYLRGSKALTDCNEQLLMVGARYGVERATTLFEMGADFYHELMRSPQLSDGSEAGNYFLPYARFEFSLARKAIKPFVEADSRLTTNDYRSLTEQNPYVMSALWMPLSTVDHAVRGGLKGSFGRDRFAYRLYADFTWRSNHLYPTLIELDPAQPTSYNGGYMVPRQDRLMWFGVGGELTFRPTTALSFNASMVLRSFDEKLDLPVGESELNAELGVRYAGRKVRFGLRGVVQSERGWAVWSVGDGVETFGAMTGRFEAPFVVDLQADFEWIASSSMTFFVEGRNLANQDIYRFAGYREYGINALVGVRMTF